MKSDRKHKLWDKKWKLAHGEAEKLGAGGQGVVRKVENLEDGTMGALKELINFNNDERRKRMHIEAVSLSVLDHPQIARILDEDTTSDGKIYIVTEFIDGITLEARIVDQAFSLEQAIGFALKILDALNHAHAIGVFHRDIKPANIMLRAGQPDNPILVDFGISFNDAESLFSAATFTGQQLGNRFLHLPELQRGARDSRSDITQLCGVFLYSITQQEPISLRDDAGRMPHQDPKCREALINAIPDEIIRGRILRMFDKAFQIEIDKRWQTSEDLASILKIIMSASPHEDVLSFSAIRDKLEAHPEYGQRVLTKRLYSEFMKETNASLNEIRKEMGEHLVHTKQGNAHLNEATGEFASNFGITVFNQDVFPRIHGNIIGDELIMTSSSQQDEIVRLNAGSPDWVIYKEKFKIMIEKLLNEAVKTLNG